MSQFDDTSARITSLYDQAEHDTKSYKEEQLPYSFDMLYDIKTKAQLVARYLEHKTELASIEETCKELDINSLIAQYKWTINNLWTTVRILEEIAMNWLEKAAEPQHVRTRLKAFKTFNDQPAWYKEN